jgi:hypothetical protein
VRRAIAEGRVGKRESSLINILLPFRMAITTMPVVEAVVVAGGGAAEIGRGMRKRDRGGRKRKTYDSSGALVCVRQNRQT